MKTELIEIYKNSLEKKLKSIDYSYRLKGRNFQALLRAISNKEIPREKIKHEMDRLCNLSLLMIRNKKGYSQKYDWLQRNKGGVADALYTYYGLNNCIYSIDDNVADFFSNQKFYEHILDIEDTTFIIDYKNSIYLVEVEKSKKDLFFYITNGFENDIAEVNSSILTSFSVAVERHQVTPDKFLTDYQIFCNNKKCPRYKQSLDIGYNDFKDVACGENEEECEYAKLHNKLLIDKLTDIAVGLADCKFGRTYPKYNKILKNYEHIPMPESDKDVVIYLKDVYDTEAKKNLLDKLAYEPQTEETSSKIVDSHASPREHTRRGGFQPTYQKVQNGKVITVQGHSFSGTVVNKGHTPCTYKVKK